MMVTLRAMRLTKAAEWVEAKAHGTLTYFAFPSNHWVPGEDQQSTRVDHPRDSPAHARGRAFPDAHSALMLVAARLRHIASTKWGKRRYLAMETLLNPLP